MEQGQVSVNEMTTVNSDNDQNSDLKDQNESLQHREEHPVQKEIMAELNLRDQLLKENIFLQYQLNKFIRETEKRDYLKTLDFQMNANKDTLIEKLGKIAAKDIEISHHQQESKEKLEKLKTLLIEKEEEYKEMNTSFDETKLKTALNSVNSDTGDTYKKEVVNELLAQEASLREAVKKYQLEVIKKKLKLKNTVKEKHNLIEGPLDFEQYEITCTAIENNKEVNKEMEQEIKGYVRRSKKAVNVLSHLSQKLHFVEQNKSTVVEKEQFLERELTELRNEVFKEMAKYDIMVKKNQDLRNKNILLQYPKLIEDYQDMLSENESILKEIEALKEEYNVSKKILTESPL